MPVDSPRYKAAKSAVDQYVEELDLYVEELEAKHKNQAEVKHAVNEAQQIADTLKQSMQTVKTDNSYGEEVKTVKFKPVVYIQNHIPKATNYESGEFTTGVYVFLFSCYAIIVLICILWNKIKKDLKKK